MRRRHLLSALAAGLVGLPAWRVWARSRAAPGGESLAIRLVSVFRQPASAMAVGRRFLDRHPEEDGAEHLTARIAGDLRARGCDLAQLDTAGLRAALAREVQADFATGRVVHLHGWVLSATEARLCGLAALVL